MIWIKQSRDMSQNETSSSLLLEYGICYLIIRYPPVCLELLSRSSFSLHWGFCFLHRKWFFLHIIVGLWVVHQLSILQNDSLTSKVFRIRGVSTVVTAPAGVASTGEPNMTQIGVKAMRSILSISFSLSLLNIYSIFINECWSVVGIHCSFLPRLGDWNGI